MSKLSVIEFLLIRQGYKILINPTPLIPRPWVKFYLKTIHLTRVREKCLKAG